MAATVGLPSTATVLERRMLRSQTSTRSMSKNKVVFQSISDKLNVLVADLPRCAVTQRNIT